VPGEVKFFFAVWEVNCNRMEKPDMKNEKRSRRLIREQLVAAP